MDIKEAMEAARYTVHFDVPRGAEGMTIDTLMEDTAEDPVNGEGEDIIEVVPTKIFTRKTKQQRQKARKVLAEVRENLMACGKAQLSGLRLSIAPDDGGSITKEASACHCRSCQVSQG